MISASIAGAPATMPAPVDPAAGAPSGFDNLATSARSLLGPTFEQTTGYGWMGLLGGIVLGVIAGRIAQALLMAVCFRLQRRGWEARGALFKYAAGPANLALVTAGVALGLQAIHMSERVSAIAYKVLSLLAMLVLAWFLYNAVELVEMGLRRVMVRTGGRLDETIVAVARKALRLFLMVLVALFVAQNIFETDVTAWLAGLGIAGLAVSLAAQDSIKNVFGSFTVLIERPFGLGDRIIFNNVEGTVEEIGFRSTRIRTLTGNLVTMPNMKFTDGSIENISRRPWIQRTINLGLTYGTPPHKIEQAVALVTDILAEPEIEAELALPAQKPQVIFNAFNADNLNVFVIYWYAINRASRDWWTFQRHAERVNLKILRAFESAGIEFAFPTRTIHLPEAAARTLARGLADAATPAGRLTADR